LWIFVHKTAAEARAFLETLSDSVCLCFSLHGCRQALSWPGWWVSHTTPRASTHVPSHHYIRSVRVHLLLPTGRQEPPFVWRSQNDSPPRVGWVWCGFICTHLHQKPTRAWCGIDTSLYNSICSHHPPQPHQSHPLLASHSVCTCVSKTSWPRTLTHNIDGVATQDQPLSAVLGTRCDRAGGRTMLRACLTTAFVATLQCPDVVLAGMGMSGMGMGATAVLSTEPSLPETATSVDLWGESHESLCCTLCSKARAMHARPPPMAAGHRHRNHHLIHVPPAPAPPPTTATTTGMHGHSC